MGRKGIGRERMRENGWEFLYEKQGKESGKKGRENKAEGREKREKLRVKGKVKEKEEKVR